MGLLLENSLGSTERSGQLVLRGGKCGGGLSGGSLFWHFVERLVGVSLFPVFFTSESIGRENGTVLAIQILGSGLGFKMRPTGRQHIQFLGHSPSHPSPIRILSVKLL